MFAFLRNKGNEVLAPVSGTCIRMEQVSDTVFSSGMLGNGFAVVSTGDMVLAPVAGEIVMIADTRHAFAIRSKDGVEVLVHIGLDTVNLKGEGFSVLKRAGQMVKAGAAIVQIDRPFMEQKGADLTTVVVFTNGGYSDVEISAYGKQVSAGAVVIS